MVSVGFAISYPDDLWVTGTILAGGKRRLILSNEKFRTIYPTHAAARLELSRMYRPDEEYRIVELEEV